MICKICNKSYSDFYIGKHVKYTHAIYPELYYIEYLNNSVGKCKECGSFTKFKSIPTGFRDFCSSKCLKIHLKTNNEFKKINNEKTINAVLDKYGVTNVFETDWCKEKINKTLHTKYGGIGMSSEIIKNKIENTNLYKYKSKNVFSNKLIIEKCVSNKNYKNISEKVKKTNLSKYGVDCIFKLESIKNNTLSLLKTITSNDIFDGNRLQCKVTPLFKKEEYIDVKTYYKWKCNICNSDFEDDLDDGKIPRCPVCFPYTYSLPELEIVNYIKQTIPNIDILINDRNILNGLELDMYIPSKKLAIEFNGIYWHTEISGGKNKNYHLDKTNLCNEKGIRLIHIFDDEWKHKKDIVCNKLLSILKSYNFKNKYFARRCIVKNINNEESNKFLNTYHIQGGNDKSCVKLGLYNENELVAVMTFGKLRVALGNKNKNDIYELYRYCTKDFVVGGAGKLFKHFIVNYNPHKIISYADIRWSIGNLYEKLNFKLIHRSSPNYWYTKNYTKRFHRFSFRKHTLSKKLKIFNPTLTEWENMKNNGYDRIWDCGNLKYEWTNH